MGISLFGGSKLLTGQVVDAPEASAIDGEEDESAGSSSDDEDTQEDVEAGDDAEDVGSDSDEEESAASDDGSNSEEEGEGGGLAAGGGAASPAKALATTFEGLGVGGWLAKQCRAVGMAAPTEVQANCVPQIIAGRDCCGYAKTGSGKTAAFALPILETLSEEPFGVYCVVLTPSRELAFQIAEQFHVRCHYIGWVKLLFCGMVTVSPQHSLYPSPNLRHCVLPPQVSPRLPPW
jgi:hypothetical protein